MCHMVLTRVNSVYQPKNTNTRLCLFITALNCLQSACKRFHMKVLQLVIKSVCVCVCVPSCSQTRSCVSVSSFLLRMAPTDPCRWRRRITTGHQSERPCQQERYIQGKVGNLDGLWDLVDVLRLHDGPQIVLQDFGEVVLQLGPSEVGQDLLPVWRILGFQSTDH